MHASKTAIFQQLQQDILALQGFKQHLPGNATDLGLGPMLTAFPNHTFPLAAVHEFICPTQEQVAATGGFLSGVLATLMKKGGTVLWISQGSMLFPQALSRFGIEPDRIIFVDLARPRDVLWAMEEALKCEGLAAVVGELQELPFTASRRLQLAVEQSLVTGFIFRHRPRNLQTNACVSRWRITPLPSAIDNELPGIGFPRWEVQLEKVRNGRPGQWELEWREGRFMHTPQNIMRLPRLEKQKTG